MKRIILIEHMAFFAEEVGQALVWLICACVGNSIFFSKVKRGRGEQLQAATSGLCEGQRSVLK